MDQRSSDRTFWQAARHMHEWPLVIFTTLVIPACGVFAAGLLSDVMGIAPPAGARAQATTAAFALAAALAVSLAHLGRPLRAPRVLMRAGRNALSTEISLALALLVLALVMLLSPLPSTALAVLARASGGVAIALLVTLGLVYFLPARWPWRSTLVVTPLLSGLAVGLLVASSDADYIVLILLMADAVLYASAFLRRPEGLPLYAATFARREALTTVRLLLVNAMPFALVIAGLPPAAVASMLAGLLVDRFTFYGAAAARSVDASIASAEATIARRN